MARTPQDVPFACRCGALGGTLHEVAASTTCHLVCYCRDCRAFARHMGLADQLEPGGGSALLHVLPARIEITQGAENLACIRLSSKGLHRWYATCCKTPIANTPGSSRIPFAGMWRGNFADISDFGPVSVFGFTKMAQPGRGAPVRDKGLWRMASGISRRSLAAYMNGTARINPFFDADGASVAVPHVLDKNERIAAYLDR